MNYRERLYQGYVTNNKSHDYVRIGQLARNLANLKRAYGPYLVNIKRTAAVLDIACGPGNVMALYRELGFVDIRGIDLSEEQIAIAKQEFPQAECGDALAFMNRQAHEYGVISAFDFLEHLTKDEAFNFLDSVNQALIPGGLLIMQMPNGDAPLGGSVIYGDMTHETIYTTTSLSHLLRTCGFEVVVIKEHGPDWHSSWVGAARWAIWQSARFVLKLLHFAETGSSATGVYTRVMRIVARKQSS